MSKIFIFVATLILLCGCQEQMSKEQHEPKLSYYAFRLSPGEDLLKSLNQKIQEQQIEAAVILSGVGSLTDYSIRFANQPNASTGKGHFEITSITGTLSIHGSHVHITIADKTGKCIGGHLMSGNIVYTTVEIVLGVMPEVKFVRELDPKSGYKELVVKKKSEN